MTQTGISELFATTAEWAILMGAERINELPGLWKGELGEFVIEINPHDREVVSSGGLTVPAFNLLITAPRYAMAFILCDAGGGIGSAGMEADVVEALKADIAVRQATGGEDVRR